MKTASTTVFITIAASFVAVVAFIVVLVVTGHDPNELVTSIIVLIGTIPGIFGIAIAQNTTSKTVAQVQTQTNGHLTNLQNQNQALLTVASPEQAAHAQQLSTSGIPTATAPAVIPAPVPTIVTLNASDLNALITKAAGAQANGPQVANGVAGDLSQPVPTPDPMVGI